MKKWTDTETKEKIREVYTHYATAPEAKKLGVDRVMVYRDLYNEKIKAGSTKKSDLWHVEEAQKVIEVYGYAMHS